MYEVLWRRLLLASLYNDLVLAPVLSGVAVTENDIEGIAEVVGWRLEGKVEHSEFILIFSEWLRSLSRPAHPVTPPSLEVFAEAFAFDSPSLSQAVTFILSASAAVMGLSPAWADAAVRVFSLLDPLRTSTVTMDTVFWLVLATVDDEAHAEIRPAELMAGAAALMRDAEAIEGRLTQTGLMRYFVLKQMTEDALNATAHRLEALAARVRGANLSLPDAGLHSAGGAGGQAPEVAGLVDLWFAAVTLAEARGQQTGHPATGPVCAFLFTRAPELRLACDTPAATAAALSEAVADIPNATEFVYFAVEQHTQLLESVCAAIGVGTRCAVATRDTAAAAAAAAAAASTTAANSASIPLSDGRAIESALLAAEWVDISPASLREAAALPPGLLPSHSADAVAPDAFPTKLVAPPTTASDLHRYESPAPAVYTRSALVLDDDVSSATPPPHSHRPAPLTP